VYKNHFINPLDLGYFWELWHEWLHLNFDGIPPLFLNCLPLNSLFWRFVSHPSTIQTWLCLASETTQDWAHSGWYGHRLKVFPDWSFFFPYCEDLLFPGFCLFIWFWSHIGGEES
jgi:hypothetical protein